MLLGAIIVLYFGAEFSLDASEKVGKKLGLSPLLIGMLLVGFGTSLPEFFVGHIAGVQGKAGIAVGSLIGSNIANMFLILGLSGFLVNMKVSNKALRTQLGIHFILGFVLLFVLTRSNLDKVTAAPLLIVCGIYLYTLLGEFKKSGEQNKNSEEPFSPGPVLLKLIGGFGMLYLGGEMLVRSGSDLCIALGISEYIVSAIFIAFGTSFPELVTSFLAAYRKKDTDLIVGNIIGSNLFNCAFILGSLGVYNFTLTENFNYEIASLIFGGAVLLGLSLTGKSINKLTGCIFVTVYLVMVGHWLKVI
ncbi:MAG: cation:H+ antiporter [Bacteriovoracaceae bacterium]|jgi:cation:H+ antiporter